MVNEHLKAWQKIVDFVVNGDLPSALIYVSHFKAQIENYINDEGKIKVYDVLNTLLDQLKGRVHAMETFGVSEDIEQNVNAIIYCSDWLDIPELAILAKIFKTQMPKVKYQDAKNGICHNTVVRENTNYWTCEEGETYYKLYQVCAETQTILNAPEEWK